MRSFNRRRLTLAVIILIGIIILLVKNNGIDKLKQNLMPANNTVTGNSFIKSDAQNSVEGQFEHNEAIVKKNITVILDAGHGGSDSGTDVNGVLEKDINLDIILRLGKLLKVIGVNVIYTRETDEYISLKDRIKMANNVQANFLISIHNNSFEDDTLVNGTSTLYYSRTKTEESSLNSKILAETVQAELTGRLKTKDAGTISRNNLGLLKQVKIPSIIAEIAFLTNPGDRENLLNEEFRQKTAEAVAISVIKVIKQI